MLKRMVGIAPKFKVTRCIEPTVADLFAVEKESQRLSVQRLPSGVVWQQR